MKISCCDPGKILRLLRHSAACAAGLAMLGFVARGSDAYSVRYSFIDSEGMGPTSIVLSSDTVYGVTAYGGRSNQGVVYQVSTDGYGYRVLKHFSGSDGRHAWGGLAKSGDALYGLTGQGGAYDWGVLYRLDLVTGHYTTLKEFSLPDGAAPSALVVSGTTVYGATEVGGTYGRGVLFSVNTDGTGYSAIRHFSGLEANPEKGLLLSGSTLYGINSYHDVGPGGMLYRVETNGEGFQALHTFSSADNAGTYPMGQIVLAGDRLYGATAWDGLYGYGAIFSVVTNGTDFKILRSLVASEGFEPASGVQLCRDTLVSATAAGGSQGNGSIIMINTNGSGFTVVKHFLGPEGAWPCGNVVISGLTVYGTTGSGGANTNGVLFALSLPLPPAITLHPLTQTAEEGSTLQLTVRASGRMPLSYQWCLNSTNLTGQTSASLVLSNLTASSAGVYTVVATNDVGSATSQPATVGITRAVQRRMVPSLAIAGDPGATLQLECATTLSPNPVWAPLDLVTLATNAQYYFDLTPALPNLRFYRAVQSGGSRTILSLNRVPAISVTGTPGSTLRIDYINQFGPIDAWQPLATILLTNSPQLYFDRQSIGQPPRLWRTVTLP